MFVMGGNVNGGKVYGEWPGLSQADLYGPGDLAITTDFRDVLGEVVEKRLQGSSLANVFPGYSTFKFRGVAKDSGHAVAPTPTIQLPFGITVPFGIGK
jgi:hypothetical protein